MSTTPGLPTPGHAAYEELTAGFALDALEPGEEQMLLAHLPDCERCQDALIAHQEVAASLTYALPSVELPATSSDLAACFASTARQLPLDPFVPANNSARRLSRSVPVSRRSLVTRQARRVLVGAGALGIIAAVGLSGYDVHLRSDATTSSAAAGSANGALQAITQPDATLAHLSGSGNSNGTAVVSDGHAWLVVKGLPKTTGGTSYVVWNLDGAKPTALQHFTGSGASGPQAIVLGVAKSAAPQSYAVTLEKTSVTAPLPASPSSDFVLTEDAHTS